jgi:hypothetical protein
MSRVVTPTLAWCSIARATLVALTLAALALVIASAHVESARPGGRAPMINATRGVRRI